MGEAAPGLELEIAGGVCPSENGFPYPDWRKISAYIKANISDEAKQAAWRDVAAQWLEKVCEALGPDYALEQSENFFFVSMRPAEGRAKLRTFVESIWARINRELRDFEFPKTQGKRVVILIDNVDDYYRYAAHFYSGERIALSGGGFFSQGYGHIVVPDREGGVENTLTHELAHNAFFGLPLPLWLNEALAMHLEAQLDSSRGFRLDDSFEEHYACWTPQSIQDFWYGLSFSDPDKSELSYSLARVLLEIIIQEDWELKKFAQNARRNDAGQSAAVSVLGRTLGTIAGTFLGVGDWEPRPPTT
jgi:hypothetical protein